MKNYGENLKEQRLMRGLTLKDIENKTGINNGNLSRWERGEVLPNIDFCVQLADFYGITVDELLGIFDDLEKHPRTLKSIGDTHTHYSSEERALIEKYRELNALGKDLVNTVIDTHLATMAESKQKKIN